MSLPGVLVEHPAHEPRGRLAHARAGRREPRRDAVALGGVLEAGVEDGEVLEPAGGGVGGDAPLAVRREPAPAHREVLEQQDEAVALARGERAAGDHHVHGRGDVGVELRLPLAHAGGADHLPVRGVDRRELHEQRRRAGAGRRVGEADAGALVGGEGVVEELDAGDLGAERFRQPLGREVGRVDRERLHRRT